MENFDILQLPEEKIIDICSQMDDITLSRFIQTSSEAKRICGNIIMNRKYNNLAEEIINKSIESRRVLHLMANLDDRDFYLEYFPLRHDFSITEVLNSNTYILQKLIPTAVTKMSSRNSELEGFLDSRLNMKDLLVRMMKLGYITGNWEYAGF